MKALFGIVSLLVALAVVGLLVARQLQTVAPSVAPAAAAAAGVPAFAASGNVREQAVQLERKVQNDVAKALAQGAAARQKQEDQ
jgi:hypothetical protein